MRRPTVSDSIPSIDLVWNFYEISREELWNLRSDVLDYLEGKSPPTSRVLLYQDLNAEQVRNIFDDYLDELECLIILDLFTATEGRVRADFEGRIRRREKDLVSRAYQDIEASTRYPLGRIPMEEIFEVWKKNCQKCKSQVGHFKGLWHFRNWLAHGRWWVFKQGLRPVVGNVKTSIEDLLKCHCLSISD